MLLILLKGEKMHVLKNVNMFSHLYFSMLGKRDDNLWVFGAWFGDKYADNSKYLYQFCLKNGMKAVWITKNSDVYNELKKQGNPVAMINSKSGVNYVKHAQYAVYSTGINDISYDYLGGATLINLWHGIPLKKIMNDDSISITSKGNKLWNQLRSIPDKNTYVFSTSPAITRIYKSAFRTDDKHIIEIGQVRNDCFFDGSLKHRTYADISYKRLISYLPTHRNEGKTKLEDHVIFNLPKLEEFCAKNDCLFLIKKHFYHNKEYTDLSAYPHIIDLTTRNDIDTQELMYNTDILITDYSSCYIDYLLLDRPIVFYCFDYEHYLKADREMYFPYDDVTPGAHAKSFDELLPALQHALDGNEKYKDKQEQVKNLFYSKENQGIVAPGLVDAIKKL